MTEAVNSATSAHQADAETTRHPIHDYADAGQNVVATIAERGATHGDPEAFGQTFADFLNAYMRPVVASGRPFTPADAFVVLGLMKAARTAIGGPQADHFRDMAGYGVLGLVHFNRRVEANKARAEAAAAAEEAARPRDDLGGLSEDAYKRGEPMPATKTPEEARRAMEQAVEDVPASTALSQAVAAYTTDHDDDPDEPADADLLRWALDPGLDPFADLLDGTTDELRPGAKWETVEARRKRIVDLLRMESDKGAGARKGAAGAFVHYQKLQFPPAPKA
jgi:hypothetical protein